MRAVRSLGCSIFVNTAAAAAIIKTNSCNTMRCACSKFIYKYYLEESQWKNENRTWHTLVQFIARFNSCTRSCRFKRYTILEYSHFTSLQLVFVICVAFADLIETTPFVCYETWEWQPVFRSAEQSRMPNYRPIKNHCGIFGKSESQVSYFLFVPTHSQFVIAVVYWYFWSPFKCPFKLCFGFVTEVRLWTSHLINKKTNHAKRYKSDSSVCVWHLL